MHKILRIFTVGLASSLLSACAIDDGRGWGEIELSMAGRMDIAAGRYDTALKAYNSADDYQVQIDTFDYRITHVRLLATAGGTISFDPENPPAPYTNCHAGHCHRTDSETTESFEEIEAKLNGSAATSTVFEQATDISDSFITPQTALPVIHGALERGQISSLALELDRVEIKGKFRKKTEESWKTFSFVQSPHQVLKLSTETDINVDRGEDYRIAYMASVELSLNFIDFRSWDDLQNDAALYGAIEKSLKLSADKH